MAFESSNCVTPLVVGVTGHRDLVSDEIGPLRSRIRALFEDLICRFPHTPLRVMTALAEGADRLAADVAIECGVDLQVVLPMSAADYRDDFHGADSVKEFDLLCARANVITLEPGDAGTPSTGEGRDMLYARAGMFISAHCHILLAIWDGQPSHRLGGTAQIIYFQHYDRLPGIAESVPRSSLFLTDDESDLVYHIACSRRQPGRSSTDAPDPLSTRWFTADRDAPSVDSMPLRYVRVFSRMDEFNHDVKRIGNEAAGPSSLYGEGTDAGDYPSVRMIDQLFGCVDRLADSYQAVVNRTLRVIYSLAILAGLAFILYTDVATSNLLIYAFLIFLLVNVMLAAVAKRRQWHRKYLDYRVLAEGLRVQFYWAVGSVRGAGETKFAYDNFLRQRDMELGWIRNVMRVAGTQNDAHPLEPDTGRLQFTIDHWIGTDDCPGQLHYYRDKARKRSSANQLIDGLTVLCFWSGIAVAIAMAVVLADASAGVRNTFLVLMGILPLIAGVAEAYTQRKADKELTKQFIFMAHVFANARRRVDEARSDPERREVLRGLGDAALTEHAEWILVHRERQPEPGGL